MFLLLAAFALADPADALDETTRPFFERAEEEAATGRWNYAANFYRMVLNQDPAFLPASLGLGRSLAASGQVPAAIALYRGLGDEPDAVEALARLIEQNDPIGAMQLWRRLETLRLGDPIPHCELARLLAGREKPSAEELDQAVASWSTCNVLLQGVEPSGPTLLSLTAALIAAERPEGEQLLHTYLDQFPEGAAAGEARARLDRMDVERAAAQLPLRSDEPLNATQAARVRSAWQSLGEGRLVEAIAIAQEMVAEAPRSAEAHGLLAEVLQAQGQWGDAEIHALIARNLAPDESGTRLRLGLLLQHAYGGRRNVEAAVELREAAALRPDSPDLAYRLGTVEQSLGNWDAAIAAYESFLKNGGEGEEAEDVRHRLENLRRATPNTPPVAGSQSRLPAEAARHYRIALELFKRGREDEGGKELAAAIALAPEAPELLNRQARLWMQAGKEEEAVRVWESSLQVAPQQGSVLLLLGELALSHGDLTAAQTRLQAAAEAGEGDAHYLLARIAAAQGEWQRVRAELESWDSSASTTSPYREAARRLQQEARQRWLVLRLAVGLSLSVVLGFPLVLWIRRRTAQTLRDLLDGAPECWHDAARILAGLRHEVLKHNTTVLPDVAAALEKGDRRPWDSLAPHAPDLLHRFTEHLDSLEHLGARFGYRLDLRHRDPILAPMFRAMRRLARLRRPTPFELRSLSSTINGSGYSALGRIVQEICVLPVTPAIVRETYERVIREPGIAGTALPTFEVSEQSNGLALRLFRNDLEDILANLLRNALAAGATTLKVVLAEDDDPITGVGMVEFQLIDNAPGTLTNAMIRGRYIGRGLGLAVDIINRHEGSIRVQPGEGFKTVVVQLPRVEPASVEAEWTA